MAKQTAKRIPALKVDQWLSLWDKVKYDPKARQSKPQPHFYLCSIAARELKALTGVYRRSARGGRPRALDPNVQRGHEEERSATIREFVKYGWPWCEMGQSKRQAKGAEDLRKPGWLPTAILVNVLEPDAERNGRKIPKEDLVAIEESGGIAELVLPSSFSGADWQPKAVYPLEVIDGQHRLWAFEDYDPGTGLELPVVAFHGLDRGWQAYLFWSVNITPKRINRSLAFDLYPLLRRVEWLERFAGHSIYRETRSQELVEALWSHPESPWYQRINMLGETKRLRGSDVPMVSQAAWVRSLMATFVKEWVESGQRPGGLFGAPRSADDTFLPWNRAMQAAFLIQAGLSVQDRIRRSNAAWARELRKHTDKPLFDDSDDRAFYGQHSLLTTDQGVRGLLHTVNDLCYADEQRLKLRDWQWEDVEAGKKATQPAATEEQAVSAALASLKKQPVAEFLDVIGEGLADYDWRTSSAPGLDQPVRLQQAVFRGSSGYRELRTQLLRHMASKTGRAAQAAKAVQKALKL
jgi:hypothetical protein